MMNQVKTEISVVNKNKEGANEMKELFNRLKESKFEVLEMSDSELQKHKEEFIRKEENRTKENLDKVNSMVELNHDERLLIAYVLFKEAKLYKEDYPVYWFKYKDSFSTEEEKIYLDLELRTLGHMKVFDLTGFSKDRKKTLLSKLKAAYDYAWFELGKDGKLYASWVMHLNYVDELTFALAWGDVNKSAAGINAAINRYEKTYKLNDRLVKDSKITLSPQQQYRYSNEYKEDVVNKLEVLGLDCDYSEIKSEPAVFVADSDIDGSIIINPRNLTIMVTTKYKIEVDYDTEDLLSQLYEKLGYRHHHTTYSISNNQIICTTVVNYENLEKLTSCYRTIKRFQELSRKDIDIVLCKM